MGTQGLSGYRKKPLAIYLFAIIYCVLPLLSLIQFSIDLDGSGSHLLEILLSQAFLLEAALSLSAALALYSVTRVGYYYFILLSLYVLGMKIYHLKSNSLFETPEDFLAALIWFGSSLVLFFTTLRIPYLNPDVKWWTQAPRYVHYRPGILSIRNHLFPIVTLDISGSGVFLKLDERAESQIDRRKTVREGSQDRREQKPLNNPFMNESQIQEAKQYLNHYPHKVGEEAQVKIHMISEASDIFPNQVLEMKAQIVWATKPTSPYRYGLGLKFICTNPTQYKQLKQYVRLVKKLADAKQGR